MGVKLTKTTDPKLTLKLVSPLDTALDWDEMLPDISEDKRSDYYLDNFKSVTLKFLPDEVPTFFVFKHPSRVDVATKVRTMFTHGVRTGKEKDATVEVFHEAFMGTEEGAVDARLETPPRMDGKISEAYIQTLSDSGVLEDLGRMYFGVFNSQREANRRKK